jgi:hypothetical protein
VESTPPTVLHTRTLVSLIENALRDSTATHMFVEYTLLSVAPRASFKVPLPAKSRRRRLGPSVRACCVIVVGNRSALAKSTTEKTESASARRRRECMVGDSRETRLLRVPMGHGYLYEISACVVRRARGPRRHTGPIERSQFLRRADGP